MRRAEVSTGSPGYRARIRPASRPSALVAALALLAALSRLPFVDRPLSPDEGGFLLLAGQWSPGSSLYGDYWVDRPPVLIGLFGIADRLGGAVGLRVVGIVAVLVSVLLAGALGRVAAPERRWAPVLTAATAAVFLFTPLFGTREVNGELLAAPFVLGGLLAVLHAVDSGGRGALAWWAAAGVLATCAIAVKQNMADVAVAGAVALVWLGRSHGLRRAAYGALAAVAGGVVALAAVLLWAAAKGTDPGALWDATVSFRLHAATVITRDSTVSTNDRFHSMLTALVHSGAPVLFLLPLLAVPRARRPGCLPFVAPAVCAWELVGVVGGGSYWWHYQIGLVPGLVLVVAALARHRPGLQASVAGLLAYSAVLGYHFGQTHPDLTRTQRMNDQAGAYLAAHARPGDTGVVAYGIPSILQRAGLRSPYRYVWSLPVRVRDPHLAELARVLRGSDRPTWMVLAAPTLDTWGVDSTQAQQVLDRRYRLVGVVGTWHFFHVVDEPGASTP